LRTEEVDGVIDLPEGVLEIRLEVRQQAGEDRPRPGLSVARPVLREELDRFLESDLRPRVVPQLVERRTPEPAELTAQRGLELGPRLVDLTHPRRRLSHAVEEPDVTPRRRCDLD